MIKTKVDTDLLCPVGMKYDTGKFGESKNNYYLANSNTIYDNIHNIHLGSVACSECPNCLEYDNDECEWLVCSEINKLHRKDKLERILK